MDRRYSLPRYVFLGPKGGGDTIRIGIFATVHGDEPEGALGLVRFISALERNPDIAKGYALFIYPMCNPTGFEDNTRHSRAGVDLNREFWVDSTASRSARAGNRNLDARFPRHRDAALR